MPNSTDPTLDFGVKFRTIFDTVSGGPIDSTDFFVPGPSQWDEATLYFDATQNGLVGSVAATVDSVTASPVPLPAAGWLFGAALLGLSDWKKWSKKSIR